MGKLRKKGELRMKCEEIPSGALKAFLKELLEKK